MGSLDDFYRILKGNQPLKPLFIPRFDLWFQVHSQKRPLLPILEGISSPAAFSRKLGFLPYSNIPDFTGGHDPFKNLHRSLGFYDIDEAPYRIKFHNTKVRPVIKEDSTYVEYATPIGTLSTEFLFTKEMKKSGASISWIKKRLIEEKADYRIMEYIFEDMEVISFDHQLRKCFRERGADCIPIAFGLFAPSGMLHILRDFLEVTDFFLHYMDLREELERLAKKIDRVLMEIAKILSRCCADAILIGANFDSTITYAPFYKESILPVFQDINRVIHSRSKKIISHCDGENEDLWDLYIQSGIDVLEAVAVYPMVKQRLDQIIKKVDGRAVIWGLVNSIALLDDSLHDSAFRQYIEEIAQVAKEKPVILGISDTAPVQMNLERLTYIRDVLNQNS